MISSNGIRDPTFTVLVFAQAVNPTERKTHINYGDKKKNKAISISKKREYMYTKEREFSPIHTDNHEFKGSGRIISALPVHND